jgi:acyl-coenzyme A thioesterase PaaI-like protein
VDNESIIYSFSVIKELCNERSMMDEGAIMLFIDNFSSIAHKMIERRDFPLSVSVDMNASFYYYPVLGQKVYLHCKVNKNQGILNCYSIELKDSDDNILASGLHTKFSIDRDSSHTIKDLKIKSSL